MHPLAQLLKCEQLRYLNLGVNSVLLSEHNRFLDYLSTNTTLTRLDLQGTIPDIYSCQQLAKALIRNSTLTYLDFSDNEVHHSHVKLFGTVLRSNTSLQTLALGENRFGTPGVKTLCDALKNNTSLHCLYMSCTYLPFQLTIVLTNSSL